MAAKLPNRLSGSGSEAGPFQNLSNGHVKGLILLKVRSNVFCDPEVIFRCYKYCESIKLLNCWRNALVDLHTLQARLQEVCES